MERKLGKGAVALMASLAMTVPAGLMPTPAQAVVFNDIRVEGNNQIETGAVLSYLDIPQGRDVGAGDINAGLQRLQNSGLFETVELVPQGGTLVVRVSEYPIVNRINFEGNRRINDERLAEIVKSQSRRVYQPSQAIADARTIAEVYASEGRLAARVDPKIIRRGNNNVDLVFEIKEGDVTEIERLSFTGNRAFSDRRLRNVLQTKQAGLLRTFIRRDTFAPERISLDEQLLTDFYRSRGYADFKVQGVASEIARERDAFFITFNIQEGPRYRFGNVTTVSEIPGVDAAAFAAQSRIKRGEVYNPSVIDVSIRRMETIAIQQQLNFVNIEPRVTRNAQTGLLDLTFALTRGQRVFVERIDIEGNTTTLDEVIRRQFTTVEGDPFNAREIRNSAERVRALGYFADAQVNTREGSDPSQVVVGVNVEEQPTGSLSFGASYGVSSGVGLTASLSERNFLGRGQTVGVTISTDSDDREGDFTFIEPFFLGRDLKAGLNLNYTASDDDDGDYNTRSLSFKPSLEFPVSDNGRLEVRYTISENKLDDVDEDSSQILQDEAGTRLSSALGYTYSWDSRRTGLDPLNAYRLRFSQDIAGAGGDTKTIETSVLAGVESTAWRDDVTLRAEVEAGAVYAYDDYDTWIIDRFGTGSRVRGFESGGYGPRDISADNQDTLGGNYYWAARAEAQFPIGLPEEYGIQGGLFADVGSLWGLDNTVGTDGTEIDDDMYVRAAIGASIYWTTPIGPLRFNFSHAVRKEDYDEVQNFDLTIQTTF
ncbi:outer membrane protein assembly factor BamA [Paracoccus sp. 1_MG-2023]|uniref:outer membrane protein assembly factor BamA n=1 Tax=unclassified Paracoccus (in: a-proteobacteria) TaxID=2688777 RepID=UPI001C08C8A4|nr:MULTISPECIES: outer membrane protein assembly factor BamA [unclassified Paracoccus (in: a-proteobacteria)]MBU2958561.1 outer membrane protein assembly factor BamA [Paracoccus sp. C2R09]MDO6667554.1 outer membrane protein assembly factor BamA [Paracoccus sp. 1_MG-2023]